MRKIVTIFLLSSFLTILPIKIHATPKIGIWPSYGGNFGIFNVEQGSGPSDVRKVWIRNEGTSALNVINISLPSAPFSIIDLPAVPFTIDSGSEVDVNIQFNPSSQGLYVDKIIINSDDPSSPTFEIPIVGRANLDPISLSTLGVFVTGEIKIIGDTDVYYFYGKAGDAVSITTGFHQFYGGSNTFSPRWELYAPDGSLVQSKGNGGSGTATLTLTGVYSLLIGDGFFVNDTDTGQYGLIIQGISGSLNSCQNIVYGQNIIDEIEAIGDTDTFCFYGNAGDTVSVTTGFLKYYGGSNTFSPRWELYAPDGSLVQSKGNGGSGTAMLPFNGIYTILIGDGFFVNDSDTGRYSLNLHCLTGPCTTTAASLCFGDFDGDGDVDGSDLAIFSASFGRTDCPNK